MRHHWFGTAKIQWANRLDTPPFRAFAVTSGMKTEILMLGKTIKMLEIRNQIYLLSLLLFTALLCTACELANRNNNNGDNNTDFSGKIIEFIIPYKEGGGSDTWARFNSTYLSKYLPGQPVVIIRNIPGGGSIKGANLFTERAKPNGLMILGTSGSTQFPFLLDDPRVRYDYANWKVIWVYGNGGVVYVSPKLGIKDASEIPKIKDKRLIYASQGPTSLDLIPLLAFDLLGLDVKAVFGMSGRGAGRLAFERGEVNIDYQTSSAYIRNVKPLVADGSAIPLFSWGILDENGNLIRDPNFPDLPHFGEVYEMVHGQKPSGIEWDSWFAFASAGFSAMKLVVVPKETPDEIIKQFQEAVEQMKKDAEYLANKERAIGEYEQVTGEKAKKLYEMGTNVSTREKEWIKNWLKEKYDFNIK